MPIYFLFEIMLWLFNKENNEVRFEFKKMGIKVLIVTIVLLFVTNGIQMDQYVRIALGVFGIGSGIMLMFLDSYRHFGE